MRFFIRCALGLGLLFLLVPLDTREKTPPEGPVGPLQALAAAREAVRDLAGLCERQPDVCATAKATLATIAARATESLRYAQDLTGDLPEKGPDRPVPDAPVHATDAPDTE